MTQILRQYRSCFQVECLADLWNESIGESNVQSSAQRNVARSVDLLNVTEARDVQKYVARAGQNDVAKRQINFAIDST